MIALAPGLLYRPGYLDEAAQDRLLAAIVRVAEAAPLFTPRMPRTGKPFSVRMTNCGGLGWVSDERGYRYQPDHPDTGKPWPAMPGEVLAAWRDLSGYPHPPDACLVNVYEPAARMGLHQDRDEEELDAPVVSLSLGVEAVFRYGGHDRRDPTRSIRLRSGDALVLGGASRLVFHGVDRLVPGGSERVDRCGLTGPGGRINLTLRKVTRPA